MGLEPTGYTAANRRTIKLMVEQAAPLFEDGSAPMFMAMGEAIAAVDVGKLFYAIAPVEEDNAGAKRLYLRTAIAPFYEDMGDDAAPVSTSNFGPTAVTVDRMGRVGASANGVTDDRAFFAALAAGTGTSLQLARGRRYYVSAPINWSRDIDLDLNGSTVI